MCVVFVVSLCERVSCRYLTLTCEKATHVCVREFFNGGKHMCLLSMQPHTHTHTCMLVSHARLPHLLIQLLGEVHGRHRLLLFVDVPHILVRRDAPVCVCVCVSG